MVFLSSFLALLLAFGLGLALVALGVFRLLFGLLRRRGRRPAAKTDRVVILGFDGLDPRIAERLMADGQLPNLKALADSGTYTRLRTTCPPMSPVAWSTFATGTNPGKHNIHDFLRRNLATYRPELSSTRIQGDRRVIRLGRYGIPVKSPGVEPLQKSKPFWEVLGENGIFSAVMRVPITYPPKRFRGLILAGMCAPDLLGTQGTFTYYTTSREEAGEFESGLSIVLEGDDGTFRTDIQGPANPIVEAAGRRASAETLPFTPYSYQVEGVRWLAGRTRALLGDDMGLGKTMQVLLALPEDGRAIIVCKSSLKFVWRDEQQLWRPDLKTTVLYGRDAWKTPARFKKRWQNP